METAAVAPAGDAGGGEKGRKAVPPNRLPSIPHIYLSTGSGREKICLLPEELCLAGAGSQSFSLPNLTLAPELQALALHGPKNKQGGTGAKHRTKDSTCNGGTSRVERRRSGPQLLPGTQLSVYCSPRVSRRGLDCSPGTPGEEGGEYAWLASRKRSSRRGSNSSVESDSSLRSASHVSTCATSDYTRFTSCDALSLANDVSPPASFPLGRLRRIYSNPESPMMNAQNESQLRDSKSCSALEEGPAAMVNYLLLEQTLSKEGTHLLSPPTLIPAAVLRSLSESQGNRPIVSYEQIYDEALKASLGDGNNEEDISNRDKRIRQWLNNVSSSPACVDTKAQPGEA